MCDRLRRASMRAQTVVLPCTRAAVTIWLRLIERAADHLAIRTIIKRGRVGASRWPAL